MDRISLPVRTEFGFQRTTSACELCSFWCKTMPGFLVPSDLQRLCPPGEDLMTWAREHLRASQGFRVVKPMSEEEVNHDADYVCPHLNHRDVVICLDLGSEDEEAESNEE